MLMCIALSDSMLAVWLELAVAGLASCAGNSFAEVPNTKTVNEYTPQITKKT